MTKQTLHKRNKLGGGRKRVGKGEMNHVLYGANWDWDGAGIKKQGFAGYLMEQAMQGLFKLKEILTLAA